MPFFVSIDQKNQMDRSHQDALQGNVDISAIGATVTAALAAHEADIGTVGDLTTTATALTTAVNELDAELGTITAGAATMRNGSISAGQIEATIFHGNTYNAWSDYRLKENIKELNGCINVDNLKPVSYNLKDSKQESIGFIAHELQEFFPQLVSGKNF